jgi:hypothetical protein
MLTLTMPRSKQRERENKNPVTKEVIRSTVAAASQIK